MLEDSVVVNKCYILRERLGEDAFCEWWRASSIFVASDFLLRFLKSEYDDDDERTQAFVASARERYNIVAPSILDLVEIDRYSGRLFLASEFGGHKNLRTALDAGLRFSVEHSCRLILELAEGIDEFHRRDTAYGMLTPESVVVRRIGERIEEIKILKPGYVLLLPFIKEERLEDLRENWGYASPELKRGELPSLSGDIYSLGVLLFRLLAGKLPYGSRSGIRVKERSAAPAHVAAALARRGMPRELSAIVVRALRKNPRLRYGEVLDFIAELRALLDSRREERLRSGGSDPIADLATLNLKRANAGAREIARSLETVDYFRFLSEAATKESDAELVHLEAPFDPEEEKAIRELEDREAESEEDDDSLSVEEILDIGYAAANKMIIRQDRTPPPRPNAPVPAPVVERVPVRQESPYEKIDWSASLVTSPPPPEKPFVKETEIQTAPHQPKPFVPPSVELPLRSGPGPATISSLAVSVAKAEKVPVDVDDEEELEEEVSAGHKGVEWNRSGGSPEAVAAALTDLFKHAAGGHGAFRFIENPGPGRPAELMANAVDAMRASGFVVDLGALPPGVELGALLAILRTALALAVLDAGKRTRNTFARRLTKADPDGYLRAAPLGFILEGANAATNAMGGEDADSASKKATEALLAFARKTRPLVLLARGTEAVGPSAHRFLLKVAEAAVEAPLCAFMFFVPGKVESWHALSALYETRG
jgi:serine/threonine protein kinase